MTMHTLLFSLKSRTHPPTPTTHLDIVIHQPITLRSDHHHTYTQQGSSKRKRVCEQEREYIYIYTTVGGETNTHRARKKRVLKKKRCRRRTMSATWFDPSASTAVAEGFSSTLASAIEAACASNAGAEGGGVSKKAAKKAEKERLKAEKAAARAKQEPEVVDPLANRYGDAPMIRSSEVTEREYVRVDALGKDRAGQELHVRARVHTVRGKGKTAFAVLRQRTATVQAVLFVDDVTVSKGMIKYVTGLEKETIVDVFGKLTLPEVPVESCTQKEVELKVLRIHAISRSIPRLPLLVEDAARAEPAEGEDDGMAVASQAVRLDNRVIDLRTPANQAIFKCQSEVCKFFRESLLEQDFIEIHTPKMIAGASEGGAAVFKLDYIGRPACLAQSPQLYKQMAVCADFERVFEIGPVFRAEKSFTHRHLTEFTGLDFEMAIKEHYFEVLDVIENFFHRIFDGLTETCAAELATINEQYPFEPLLHPKPTLRITFDEGCALLKEAGYDADPTEDIGTEQEKALGRIVREKYKTDFYVMHRYPVNARPFYTMLAPDNESVTNSYDIFIRGEEIISGAQRIHDTALLEKRAIECGIDPETIRAYLESFSYGAPPHGGCGIGLERVVMLFLGLKNIRKTSMFPRDPQRLTP